MYGSSGVLGTKGGGSMAAAWAVMHHLGNDGYQRVTAAARAACLQLAAAVGDLPELHVWRRRRKRHCWRSARPTRTQLDIFAVADACRRRGWYVDRQGPPASLALHGQRGPRRQDRRVRVRSSGQRRRGASTPRQRGDKASTAPSSNVWIHSLTSAGMQSFRRRCRPRRLGLS